MKSQRSIKIVTIHPEGSGYVCTKFHGKPANSCWNVPLKNKIVNFIVVRDISPSWWTKRPSDWPAPHPEPHAVSEDSDIFWSQPFTYGVCSLYSDCYTNVQENTHYSMSSDNSGSSNWLWLLNHTCYTEGRVMLENKLFVCLYGIGRQKCL